MMWPRAMGYFGGWSVKPELGFGNALGSQLYKSSPKQYWHWWTLSLHLVVCHSKGHGRRTWTTRLTRLCASKSRTVLRENKWWRSRYPKMERKQCHSLSCSRSHFMFSFFTKLIQASTQLWLITKVRWTRPEIKRCLPQRLWQVYCKATFGTHGAMAMGLSVSD